MSRTARTVRSASRLPIAIVAVVLLFVALAGGSAVAAKLITGKDIKNSSVTGADVKTGTIPAKDLTPNAKNQVRFQDGSDQNLGTCTDTALDDCSAVAITGLSPGTWLVTGAVTVDTFAGDAPNPINRCGLWRDGLTLAESRTTLAAHGAVGEAEAITLQQVVVATDSSTPVSLKCTELVGDDLRVGSPTITALKVS